MLLRKCGVIWGINELLTLQNTVDKYVQHCHCSEIWFLECTFPRKTGMCEKYLPHVGQASWPCLHALGARVVSERVPQGHPGRPAPEERAADASLVFGRELSWPREVA